MNLQTIIVGIIILAALLFVGKALLGKIQSFTAGKSCGMGCGCEPQSNAKNISAQIKR